MLPFPPPFGVHYPAAEILEKAKHLFRTYFEQDEDESGAGVYTTADSTAFTFGMPGAPVTNPFMQGAPAGNPFMQFPPTHHMG